jgi:hypothetical protein
VGIIRNLTASFNRLSVLLGPDRIYRWTFGV